VKQTVIELPAWNHKQAEFLESTEKYVLLLGGAGSGKSLALVWWCILQALNHPGSRGVILRMSYPALRDSTKRTFMEAVPVSVVAKEVKSEGRESITFINGSTIDFRAFDSPLKLGSQEFDYIGADEVIELDDGIFRTLTTRLRGKRGPRRMACATNPPDESSFLYHWWEEEPLQRPSLRTERRVIHSSAYDNAAHLPPDYIEQLERLPPAYKERFLYGRWGPLFDEQPVFPEFDVERHMAHLQYDPALPLIRGWDFGRRSPACVWLQVTPGDEGVVQVLREHLGKDIDLRQFARQVVDISTAEFPGARIEDYCDIAGTQKNDRGPTSVSVLKLEFGVDCYYRKYGRMYCVERVAGLIRHDRFRVNVACRTLRRAMVGGYHMDKKTDQPAQNSPYADVFDALKYPVCAVTQPISERYVLSATRQRWRMAV